MPKISVLFRLAGLLLLVLVTASAGSSPLFPNANKQRLTVADLTRPSVPGSVAATVTSYRSEHPRYDLAKRESPTASQGNKNPLGDYEGSTVEEKAVGATLVAAARNAIVTTAVTGNRTTTYSYDFVGNLVSAIYPNGTITTYAYNDLNRLVHLLTVDSFGVVVEYFYTLDTVGRRIAINDHNGQNITYEYDVLGRLVAEQIIDASNAITHEAGYEYDSVGNRIRSVINGAETLYTYDANDRLIQAGARTYEYDANGNVLHEVGPMGEAFYTYNSRNQLIKADKTDFNGPSTSTYTYNADGNRASSTVNEVTTHYLVDTNRNYPQVLEETDDAGNLLASYSYGLDLISQDRVGQGTRYYHYDGLGSARALTDDIAVVTDTYDYDAFGVMLESTGNSENSYLFSGEQFDSELGQYYLRARNYDPYVGRFTQMDLWPGVKNDPISLHKYLYANADPINNTDPSGNLTLSQISIGLTVGGAVLGTSVGGYAGYQIGGVEGAIGGGVGGGIAGAAAGWYVGYGLFAYVPAAIVAAQTWFIPASRFLQGPGGRVSFMQLDRLRSTPVTTLYSNISRTLESTRQLFTSPLREVAAHGSRVNYLQHEIKIPQGIFNEMLRVGSVFTEGAIQVAPGMGIAPGIVYVFTPQAVAYIQLMQYVKVLP